MSKKLKAIIIGEYSRVEYHPFKGADKELIEILADFEIECTEEYDRFKAENLNQYDLCISFVDHWKEKLSDEQTAGLLTYVSNGGALLIIHNGIAIQNRYELAQLAGGKFVMHPDQKVLSYRPSLSEHIIMEGIGGFELMEEPYQFEFDSFTEKTILLEYDSEGKSWPAAWAHCYGLGRVAYLSPGHNIDSFLNPMYRKLINRGALWVTGLL